MPYGDFTPENNFGEEGCGSSELSGPREHGRPEVFCEVVTCQSDVTMLQNLTVTGDVVISGNVTIAGNLTVSGTIKAPFFDGVAKEAVTAQSIG